MTSCRAKGLFGVCWAWKRRVCACSLVQAEIMDSTPPHSEKQAARTQNLNKQQKGSSDCAAGKLREQENELLLPILKGSTHVFTQRGTSVIPPETKHGLLHLLKESGRRKNLAYPHAARANVGHSYMYYVYSSNARQSEANRLCQWLHSCGRLCTACAVCLNMHACFVRQWRSSWSCDNGIEQSDSVSSTWPAPIAKRGRLPASNSVCCVPRWGKSSHPTKLWLI